MSRHIHMPRMAVLNLFIPLLALGLGGTASAAQNCDRACLSGLVTQYMDALVARDVAKLPLAAK